MPTQTSSVVTDPKQWAVQQFSTTQLGDRRRTQRAVQLGAAIARHSSGSLPQQTKTWAALKAAYRLLNEKDVTHGQVSLPHWQNTQQQASQSNMVVLFIQDTSTIDFSSQRSITGLGYIGDQYGYGCEVQSCLAVQPTVTTPTIFGLAQQTIWTRSELHRPTETKKARWRRRTEADIWAETLEAIGVVPNGKKWVSVGDRGSDVFSYLVRAKALGWKCLFRVTHDRRIITPNTEEHHLKQWIRAQPALTQKTVTRRGRDGKPQRTVPLQVMWSRVVLQSPRNRSIQPAMPVWMIRCWNDVEDMEWILCSTVPVTTNQEALEQIQWYECRWLIEEYHKCLKTGCALEDRQLTTAQGIFTLLGFLSVTAVRLLQLRQLARSTPETPAKQIIDPLYLALVAHRLKKSTTTLTLKQFWHGVARFGGFIGRKSDGEPGWQTIWRGWNELSLIVWGAEWMQEQKRCG